MRVNGPSSASIGHAAQGDDQPAPVSHVPTPGALSLQPAPHMEPDFNCAPEHLPLPLDQGEAWSQCKASIGLLERELDYAYATGAWDSTIKEQAQRTVRALHKLTQFENTSVDRELDLLGKAIDICLELKEARGLDFANFGTPIPWMAARAHALYTERAIGVPVRIREWGGAMEGQRNGKPGPAHKVDLLAYCRARQAAAVVDSWSRYDHDCSLHELYEELDLSRIPIPDVDARALSRYEFELLTSGSTPAYWTTQSSSAEETQLRWKFTDAAVKAALAYKARLAHQLEADMPRGDPTLGVDDRTTVAKLVAEYTQQSNRLTG